MTKPHHGRITNWTRYSVAHGPFYGGVGYFIFGHADGHPEFDGWYFHTSYVVSHDEATGEIETRNSRYTLVGAEIKRSAT